MLGKEISYAAMNFGRACLNKLSCNLHKYDVITTRCAQHIYEKFCKPHTKLVFYDLKCTNYTSGYYLQKVASMVAQNVDTVTVKYTYHCDCQAVPDNHSDSNYRLLKKIVNQHETLAKKQVGIKCPT